MNKNVSTGGVHITLNGYYIPGNPTVIASTILANQPNLDMWSTKALLNLYMGLIELIMEYFVEVISEEDAVMTKSSAKRHYKKWKNRKQYGVRGLLKPDGRDRLLRRIYELILEGEDLPNLRGFSFANSFGDSLAGNAETQTCKKGW